MKPAFSKNNKSNKKINSICDENVINQEKLNLSEKTV